MAIDVKEIISNVTERVKGDKDIKKKFDKDPVKTIEDIIGISLPDEIVENVVNTIQTTIKSDGIGDVLGNIGSLLGKK